MPLPVSQCHPSDCLLATSGIENVIRLWAPGEGGSQQARGQAQNLAELIASNQVRGSGAAGGEGRGRGVGVTGLGTRSAG